MITSAKRNPEQAQASNRILMGTEIEGNLLSNGDFRIDGTVKGNIQIDGKLVIGEKGRIEGEIICANANISGYLKGKIHVSELLHLESTAIVKGDVITSKLSIQPGAELSGTCSMGSVVREMKHSNNTTHENAKTSKETA